MLTLSYIESVVNPFAARDDYVSSSLDASPERNDK